MNASFELVRAVRGPLVLIALGLLFLLDQTDTASFQRTWPVLFIVFGCLKLVERLLAPPVPPPPAWAPPPTQGGYHP